MKKLLFIFILLFAVCITEANATPTYKKPHNTILSKRSNRHRDYIIATNRFNCNSKTTTPYKSRYSKSLMRNFLFIRF
jgi:hypothetical protein